MTKADVGGKTKEIIKCTCDDDPCRIFMTRLSLTVLSFFCFTFKRLHHHKNVMVFLLVYGFHIKIPNSRTVSTEETRGGKGSRA